MGNKKKTRAKRKRSDESKKEEPFVPHLPIIEGRRSPSTGGGVFPYYDGDPTELDPSQMERLEQSAKFAIDVYNRTHLIKYNFVDVKSATRDAVWMQMIITAKPVDDENNPVFILAWVKTSLNTYVKLVEIVRRADLRQPRWAPEIKRDRTRCDGKTRDILKEITGLALEAYHKTYPQPRYGMLELVRATGHSSVGSVVDLIFTAKPISLYMASNIPYTFRARVSCEHKNVEFVSCDDVRDMTRVR